MVDTSDEELFYSAVFSRLLCGTETPDQLLMTRNLPLGYLPGNLRPLPQALRLVAYGADIFQDQLDMAAFGNFQHALEAGAYLLRAVRFAG